jgi:hypothetical protein
VAHLRPSTRSPTWPHATPDPRNWPPGSVATGRSRTGCTGCAMSPTPRTRPRSAPAPPHRSWHRCATSRSACTASPAPRTSPRTAMSRPRCAPTTPGTQDHLTLPTPWFPHIGPLLTHKLNTDLIAEHHDDLLRLAGSLKFGRATASLLVGKMSVGAAERVRGGAEGARRVAPDQPWSRGRRSTTAWPWSRCAARGAYRRRGAGPHLVGAQREHQLLRLHRRGHRR